MKLIYFLTLFLMALIFSCNNEKRAPKMISIENAKYVFSIDSTFNDTLEIDDVRRILSHERNQNTLKDIIYANNWCIKNNNYIKNNFYFHEPLVFNDNKLGSRINFILFNDSLNEYYYDGILKTNVSFADSLSIDLNKVYIVDNKIKDSGENIFIKSIKWSYKSGILAFKLKTDSDFRKVNIIMKRKR